MTTDRPARALILDFNGTVSHDEHIVLELFQELFAEHGRPLDAATYERQLAGMSDPEIVWAWLGRDHPAVEQVVRWLFAHKTVEAVLLGGPERLHHLPGGERAGADVAHLARADKIVQRAQRLVDRRR